MKYSDSIDYPSDISQHILFLAVRYLQSELKFMENIEESSDLISYKRRIQSTIENLNWINKIEDDPNFNGMHQNRHLMRMVMKIVDWLHESELVDFYNTGDAEQKADIQDTIDDITAWMELTKKLIRIV